MALERMREPFGDPDWIFELKYDGFRALAHVGAQVELVSRRGRQYRQFEELRRAIREDLAVREAVIDGEIVCLDQEGRPQFVELLRRRGEPVFIAFDLLTLDGRDLRELPLLERKQKLRRIIPGESTSLLYLDHIEGRGRDLFAEVCARDLEGVVGKLKHAPYRATLPSSWAKILNPGYSQANGRGGIFAERTMNRGTLNPNRVASSSYRPSADGSKSSRRRGPAT
jgi:bifunctional non-homologous end joining protein LigD